MSLLSLPLYRIIDVVHQQLICIINIHTQLESIQEIQEQQDKAYQESLEADIANYKVWQYFI